MYPDKSKLLTKWNKQKIFIDRSANMPKITEGELWWCAQGQNVGVEISGKSDRFARPVLIYKKLNRHNFLAIPISTQIKDGSWYVKFMFKNMLRVAVLSQIKVLSVFRLYDKMGQINQADMNKIIQGFNGLYKKSSPSPHG